jgi:hypothetical protein
MPKTLARPSALLLALLLALLWQVPATAGAEPAATESPAAAEPAPPPTIHGLLGEYFTQSAPGAHDLAVPGGTEMTAQVAFTDLRPLLQAKVGAQESTSARWTGRIEAPTTGDYTFSLIGDNGFRLWVDDTLVIDHWVGDWDVEQTSAPVTLAAGESHAFRLEYFQDVGGANLFLRWTGPGIDKQLVPQSAFTVAAPASGTDGLRGEYYRTSGANRHDFAQLGLATLEPNIDFADLVPVLRDYTDQTEHTTARWTGQIEAPVTGDFTFSAIGDNGFRLFIDDQPVIDHWVGDWDVEQTSAPVHLEAGVPHLVRIEHFQDIGGANLFLRWSGPGIEKTIVPTTAFTPPPGFEIYPVDLTLDTAGRTLRVDFEQPVTDLADAAAHLAVTVDTTPYPVASVALDPADASVVVVTLQDGVFAGQRVRFTYDGAGGLAVGGDEVPNLTRYATNTSTARMQTPWADDVDPLRPLPEYPRPQQVRSQWRNLNGPWEFAGAAADEAPPFGTTLAETVTVPYPVESQLSGLERHEDHMFYRRLVDVPRGWDIGYGQRLVLNFGAVDHHATVYVNGTQVAEHTGGYTAFSADITDALRPRGTQEIVVAVTDTTGDDQAVGKQSRNPGGIVYTASSGIWQTVWMEPVPVRAIDELVLTPDITAKTLSVTVASASARPGATVVVRARDARGRTVGTVTGRANTPLTLPVKKQHLWTPDDPYLYDLRVELKDGRTRDTVESYFAMRSIDVQQVGGYPKLVLNGKPIFSLAMLDQGFWPDGLHTAPTDEALRWDLQAQKDLGFNAVRKHIKVEPDRWYKHADEIGLLVWQDFVSGNWQTDQGKQDFVTQGVEMMDQLHNHPSVIGYVVFNEGWGEWDRTATGQIVQEVQAHDPSRVINAHSGVNCCNSKGDSGTGDVIDHHDYNNTDPAMPDATRAAMDGEHGGFTLRTPGHMYPGTPLAIYSGVESKELLTRRYVDNTETFYLWQAAHELSGSVYTQVTDLEHEINGMWTYDRRELKVDAARVVAINERVIAAGAGAGEPVVYPGEGCWALDETSGTTGADACGDSDVTTSGGAAWVAGVHGGALALDGVDDAAETAGPVVDTTADYSVAAWVRLDALPGNYATAVSQDGRAQASPFYLQYGQGAFAFSLPGEVRARLETTPELGRWYHLVGVRDQATDELTLYVDGRPAATTGGGVDGTSTGSLAIGRAKWAGQDGDFWNGAIDDVRVYDRVLTDAEVAELATR